MKMIYKAVLCLFLVVAMCSLPAGAKVKKTPIYIFGYAASYVDSLAYLTDIQRIDTAYIETKGGFLQGRNQYSNQLKQYVEEISGKKNISSAVFFSEKKKQLEKTMQKVQNLCRKDTVLRYAVLPPSAFRFHGEQWIDLEIKHDGVPVNAGEESEKATTKKSSKSKRAKR